MDGTGKVKNSIPRRFEIGSPAGDVETYTSSLGSIEVYLAEKYPGRIQAKKAARRRAFPITREKYIELRETGLSRGKIALKYVVHADVMDDVCNGWGLGSSERKEIEIMGWETKKKHRHNIT